MIISSATEFDYVNGKEYLIIANGGNLTVKRFTEAGSWEDIPGSPVLDGEEKFVTTASHSSTIQITPSVADTEATLIPVVS